MHHWGPLFSQTYGKCLDLCDWQLHLTLTVKVLSDTFAFPWLCNKSFKNNKHWVDQTLEKIGKESPLVFCMRRAEYKINTAIPTLLGAASTVIPIVNTANQGYHTYLFYSLVDSCFTRAIHALGLKQTHNNLPYAIHVIHWAGNMCSHPAGCTQNTQRRNVSGVTPNTALKTHSSDSYLQFGGGSRVISASSFWILKQKRVNIIQGYKSISQTQGFRFFFNHIWYRAKTMWFSKIKF